MSFYRTSREYDGRAVQFVLSRTYHTLLSRTGETDMPGDRAANGGAIAIAGARGESRFPVGRHVKLSGRDHGDPDKAIRPVSITRGGREERGERRRGLYNGRPGYTTSSRTRGERAPLPFFDHYRRSFSRRSNY